MHWSDKYIGLPYSDHNCAQFIAKVSNEQYGLNIQMPSDWPTSYIGQQKTINREMFNYVQETPLKGPEDGAVCIMNASKRVSHIGLVIDINSIYYVLHCINGVNASVRHKLRDLPLHNLTVERFYKWQT